MRSGEPPTARTRIQDTEATMATRPSAPGPMALERYQLRRRLGTGAFGTVWLARDERLERDVAVKILARERVMGGRFEREARAAARLSHPAIVTLYEAAVDDEGAYLVSELVRGETLGALLEEGRLSDRDIVDIGIALCDALRHAHEHGVVHRDVKPSNVLVPETPAGAAQVAKLTDFGVARVMDGDALTLTGDVLGTLAYMAPEQANGHEAGEPADLYSLALVIYEALSGINPVAHVRAGRSSVRVGMHLPPLRRQRRDLPAELAGAIDRALRPRPADRGAMAELRRALADAQLQVGDEPGIVTGAWESRPWSTLRPRRTAGGLEEEGDDALWREPRSGPGAAPARDEPSGETGTSWPPRALGALAAAALAAWLSITALAPSPVPPAVAGLVAGAAVLVLPRLGWAALTCGLAAGALSEQRPGAALIIAIALLLPVVACPARATSWPLPAGAPALGLIGLAGAWPAVAARAGGVWTRAAVGAVGWVWLLLGAAIAGKALYLPRVPGTVLAPPPQNWMTSPSDTVTHLLSPLISSGVLAPAAIWAAAAVILPWLVRGRSVALDVLRVVAWATIVVSCTGAAIAAVHGSDPIGAPPTALVGAAAAAAVALAPSLLEMWREALHSGGPRARVP